MAVSPGRPPHPDLPPQHNARAKERERERKRGGMGERERGGRESTFQKGGIYRFANNLCCLPLGQFSDSPSHPPSLPEGAGQERWEKQTMIHYNDLY